MESDKENIITYETIFELVRKERASDALQRLEQGFYSNIVSYIKEKSGSDDRELILNVKKMIKEIYERRERKIVGLAIDRVKLGMDGLNTSNLLKEERWVFDSIVEDLLSGRKAIIEMILSGKEPLLEHLPNEVKENQSSAQQQNNLNSGVNLFTSAETLLEEKDIAKTTSLVRFLHAVPRFVGKELEEYGPFEAEEVANIPTEIANLLIAKGRAEEIREK